MNIIQKLKQANLTGRGGGCFPVYQKWELVKKGIAVRPKNDRKCYIICNASEGEPGIEKDFFILNNHPDELINGINIAVKFFKAEKAYIYINPHYFFKLESKLRKAIKDLPIEIFKKDYQAGYIGGEETSAINHIEGGRIEPRLRPPYPPLVGLWGYPTLVNNVETFYSLSLVNQGKYRQNRFYTINGDCLNTGVFEHPEHWTIEKILKESENFPKFDFFVQVGGDASGEVLNQNQLRRPVGGGGSITVYSLAKHEPIDLFKKWIRFFRSESCGQCTPCREGVYRLKEILYDPQPNWQLFSDLLDTLSDTSFCGLGCAVPIPVKSYVDNVLKNKNIGLKRKKGSQKMICDCFD